ncbi:MAG: cyclase family protein, partial [Deltaproteobacteria bacterium]|nr:cyclase family protein [Deltaproteobacteria bacterium]
SVDHRSEEETRLAGGRNSTAMEGYRLIDLSLPLQDGGGFTKPARIRYIDHGGRARGIAENFGINIEEIQGRANAMEEIDALNTHTGTHFDAPGERGMCLLEWLTNLELLPPFGFEVCAFPVKIRRAGGAWARIVALIKE